MTNSQKAKCYQNGWSEWSKFPDISQKDYIYAPFGPGVYQLRNARTGELVLFGEGKNVAQRMTTLIEGQVCSSTRKSQPKKDYVGKNLEDIEYRTIGFATENEAKEFEEYVKSKETYIFPN